MQHSDASRHREPGVDETPCFLSIPVQIDAYNTSLVMNFFQQFLRGRRDFLENGGVFYAYLCPVFLSA
jgi:hypothetical protein